MSHLGCLGGSAGAHSPLLLYGNIAYVQTAAASCIGGIPSCLDGNLEIQHPPFQQWQFELHVTLFDSGQSGQLPPGAGGITIGEQSSRAS